jgi:hypothetical protein
MKFQYEVSELLLELWEVAYLKEMVYRGSSSSYLANLEISTSLSESGYSESVSLYGFTPSGSDISFEEFTSSTKNLNLGKNPSGNRFESRSCKLGQVPLSKSHLDSPVELEAFMNSASSKKRQRVDIKDILDYTPEPAVKAARKKGARSVR